MTSEEFKAWRALLGLRQHGAADALGLSTGSIELYARGARFEDGRTVVIPRTVELACVACLFHVDVDPGEQLHGLVDRAFRRPVPRPRQAAP